MIAVNVREAMRPKIAQENVVALQSLMHAEYVRAQKQTLVTVFKKVIV